MKTKLLKLALCAMAALPFGAWADDVSMAKQFATTKFVLQHSGNTDKEGTVTGGTFDATKASTANANGWNIKTSGTDYLKITKTEPFAVGDIISVVVVYKGNYSSGRGITIANAASSATFSQNIELPSWYKDGSSSGAKATLRYALTADDVTKVTNDLYFLFKDNQYWIQRVEVGTDSYATSPNPVSTKTWELWKLFGNQSTGNSFANYIINDDLFYAKSTPLFNYSGIFAVPRLTSAASSPKTMNESSTFSLSFKLAAGSGFVTVYSTQNPRYYLGDGAVTSFDQIPGVTETVGSDTYYAYVMSYNVATTTTFAIIRNGSSNTPIYKIVVAPTVNVSIASSGYSTFCSPVALDLANLPSGLKAYKVESSNVSSTKVTLTEVTEAVKANTPLILAGTGGASYDIPVTTSDNDISTTNALVQGDGTTDGVAKEVGFTKFVLQGGQFKKIDTTPATVPTTKAYLKITGDVAANALTLDFGDVTAIKSVKETSVKSEDYYNLNGQRVAQPQKGLYIVNGKKVIIK